MKTFLEPKDIIMSLTNTPQITFEITESCNLKCSYCIYGDLYNNYDPRQNRKLSEKKAYNLLDYLSSLWQSKYNCSFNKNVYISFYGGEPLLNMSFIRKVVDYVEKLNSKTRNFTFTMTTNGVLLNKYIDYLVDKKFQLLISLDGNKENSDYRVDYKGKSTFNSIISNVKDIQIRYPDFFRDKVNFNAVLHNKNSIEDIQNFFRQHFDKVPIIGELNNVGIRKDKINEFNAKYRNATTNLFQSEHYSEIERKLFMSAPTYNSAALYLLQFSDFVYNDYNELLYGKKRFENICPTGTCIPFSRRVFITIDGKILPCERIGHQYALGKITEEQVSLNFEDIANLCNTRYEKMENQCNSCYNKKTCVQCMYNLPNIDAPSVTCYGFMDKKSFERYKETQLSFFRRNPDAYFKIMNDVIFQ